MKKLSIEARMERNLYQRQWRQEHKERVQKYNADYWQRRAEKRKTSEAENYSKGEINDQ